MSDVARNIVDIYKRREASVYALCLEYSGRALNLFRERQSSPAPNRPEGGKYWENQTTDAMALMFADAFIQGNDIGWFMAHGAPYGVYLELANDGQNAAIKPIIIELLPEFNADLKRIYA